MKCAPKIFLKFGVVHRSNEVRHFPRNFIIWGALHCFCMPDDVLAGGRRGLKAKCCAVKQLMLSKLTTKIATVCCDKLL